MKIEQEYLTKDEDSDEINGAIAISFDTDIATDGFQVSFSSGKWSLYGFVRDYKIFELKTLEGEDLEALVKAFRIQIDNEE